MSNQREMIRMEEISKSFGGVAALDKVNFCALSGEIHALIGENGAGKSTLMKCLAGAYEKDEGTHLCTTNQVMKTHNSFHLP